ncbi:MULTISPECIES: hypothetical protein [Actinomyces]|uniref:hypothetical protein n=1 Tax=Actinomyces TaxID=1654 RepID=UPI0009B584A7|nr:MULTISPECIES: hypothetical protein [Actinomyces]
MILIVCVLAAASFIHYLKYGREDEPAVPETICDGLLNVEEISRLAHGPVGSEEYHKLGNGDELCTAKRPLEPGNKHGSPRGLFTYELQRVYSRSVTSSGPRYKPGGGVKLRVSSLDASIAGGEEGVARIDPPVDGEGDAFLWCPPNNEAEQCLAIWFTEDFILVVRFNNPAHSDPEGLGDGPTSFGEIWSLLPDLMDYVGTRVVEAGPPSIWRNTPPPSPTTADPEATASDGPDAVPSDPASRAPTPSGE